MVRPSLAKVLVLGAACAACAPWSTLPEGTPGPGEPPAGESRPAVAARAADGSLAAFLGRAAPGETAAVTAAGGGSLLVTVAQDYHAASGKTCRRLLVSEDGAAPGEREACRDEVGVWRLLPLLHNRELPHLTAGAAAAGGGSL